MSWRNLLAADSVPWLLERDTPGVRYLALRDLADDASSAQLRKARAEAHARGPIAVILGKMEAAGCWAKPGPGYNPKYRSTVWSMIALAQLGASIHEDRRIQSACDYVLDHSFCPGGEFTSLTAGSASGVIDCLQGNLCGSLLELGCRDPRLDKALDWMARSVTGVGFAAPGYTYKTGPAFECGVNASRPCAWGGVKVMLALARVPPEHRTPAIRRAMCRAADFFFSIDPATAAYPTRLGGKPSPNWWKFGFPVFYVTDLLQLAEALTGLGYGRDPRLAGVLQTILSKQDDSGRWLFEFDYLNGKMWLDFGRRGQPNKWITLRALRVLKAADAR